MILKKALITGITGQDGSYLAELLLSKDYEVHGIIRRSSDINTRRIDHIYMDPHNPQNRLHLHYGDMSDGSGISQLIFSHDFDEVYNLAAQSHVKVSFDMPDYTSDVTGLGTLRVLEAIRRSGKDTKFYQASSSELYGSSPGPQDEETPFLPQSPYAVSKLYSYWMTRNYRDAYGMFTSNGILFNHESPRRDIRFVTRKITYTLSKIFNDNDSTETLYLGNLYARRDWGYAPEYVEAMWMMLQKEEPGDYVIGTGETHTVKEFVSECLDYISVDYEWTGSGEGEVCVAYPSTGSLVKKQSIIVAIDPNYYRPNEVYHLEANPKKAFDKLGWQPSVKFKELVGKMMSYDMANNK